MRRVCDIVAWSSSTIGLGGLLVLVTIGCKPKYLVFGASPTGADAARDEVDELRRQTLRSRICEHAHRAAVAKRRAERAKSPSRERRLFELARVHLERADGYFQEARALVPAGSQLRGCSKSGPSTEKLEESAED